MNTSKLQDLQLNLFQNPENTNVNVYLRMANSKSIKIQLPTNNNVDQIRLKIQELIKVDIQNQILFYNGKELLDGMQVKLKEKAIIHIKCKEENIEKMVINIIKHSPQERNIFKLNFQQTHLQINPISTIGEVIKNILRENDEQFEYRRTKVIECGRFLRLHRTFKEEKIHSYTEIHLILRKRIKQNQVENDQQQKMLIESVLKRSSNNLITTRECKTDRIFALLDHQYEERQDQNEKFKQPQSGQEKKEDDFEDRRRSLPNYFTATKASQFWQSQKYIRKEITPLKFSFREYKKYEGPKSVRECNCKRKTQFYQGCEHLSESGDKESPRDSSSLKDSRLKSSKILKTRVSMFF